MGVAEPSLTVVMPVHNAGLYLDAAIASIRDQTYRDFRFVIGDDCSTDGSYQRALAHAADDPRIEVIRSDRRLGPVASSNLVARAARTEFVARMDADDIAWPDRLAWQMDVLAAHPNAVLVGSLFDLIDGAGRRIRPASPSRIASSTPPFCHPTILYRRAWFEAAGGYREGTDFYEDYDLYDRMAALGPLLVINAPLVSVRFAAQHTRLKDESQAVEDRLNRRDRQDAPAGAGRTIMPGVFYSIAVLRIMAGRRPRQLRRMARRMRLSPLGRAAGVTLLVLAATLSPRLVRYLGSRRVRAGDRRHARALADGHLYAWSRTGPPVDLSAR